MNRFEFNVAMTISYNALEVNSLRLDAINVLTNELGRKPSNSEIAFYMGISDKKINELEIAFKESLSLFSKVVNSSDDDNDTTFVDFFEDKMVDAEKDVF